MEFMQRCADTSIRRACAFTALGIAMVMLALSYDLLLALRSGAVLTTLTLVVVWLLAWCAPRRDVRSTEAWMLFVAERPYLTAGPDAAQLRMLAARMLRDRLVWHADRIAVAALVLWCCVGLAAILDALLGG
jgi:hypothetical protein